MIRILILYAIMISAFIYAENWHIKILKFLRHSKKQYIEYMKDSSLGAGL
jgi:hypothetical protein